MWIIWRAYRELLGMEYSLLREDFPAIYDKVRNTPVVSRPHRTISVQQICHGIDLAAALYFKQALCLQRSAATACLLKKYGFPAELVIGVQQLPFLAHAWVELEGRVVNDKPYISEMYSVLSRC
jgi:Transglutaminase-like superfamily